jgi:hypothetical protein
MTDAALACATGNAEVVELMQRQQLGTLDDAAAARLRALLLAIAEVPRDD